MSLLDELSCAELAERFRDGLPDGLPSSWETDSRVLAAHHLLARQCLERMSAYPNCFRGRGVVVCAGGHRLFTNAWVAVRVLRHLGCRLPIQFWHLGESEMDDTMRRLVAAHGVECVDAERLAALWPARRLYGWELKAYALVHCPFQEVLLLDADNVALHDPTFLFNTPEYQAVGAIFWPDFSRLEPDRLAWAAFEVDYRDEPEIESGQLVVDKSRCWPALQLALHYNEHSDFYYCHVHGDKETFHLAFRRLGLNYAMPARGIHALEATMCQHDFQNRRHFQHRNMDKWRYDGRNSHVKGFHLENLCRDLLAELRLHWSGRVHWSETFTPQEALLMERWGGGVYMYERVGADNRRLELRRDRSVGEGAAEREEFWTITTVGGVPSLVLFGPEGPTCRLTPHARGWQGHWYHCERMPIRLRPLDNGEAAEAAQDA